VQKGLLQDYDVCGSDQRVSQLDRGFSLLQATRGHQVQGEKGGHAGKDCQVFQDSFDTTSQETPRNWNKHQVSGKCF
jgi:hypothetical protein